MKILKVVMAAALFLAMNSVSFANFSDVDEKELYYKGIKYLEDNGIIDGYEDGTFKPKNEVNRAEMLKIVITAKGVTEAELAPYANDNCFQDVPAGVWYTKYVCYAKAQGWVNGYDEGKFFRPGEPINAVEALKIVLAIWGIEYEETPAIWYKGVVERAAESNYIPFDVSNFGANLHRDQMSDMIARIMNEDAETLDDYLGPRSILISSYATIQKAMSDEDWDVDPNHNALVLTTILTSQVDDEKVFTILDVPNEMANDASIASIPKTFMYAEGPYTYYYMTSAVCILEGKCSETQLEKIDEILTEAWFAAESFSLGQKAPGDGCYYVSDQDFQLTLPKSWGAIHDFTMMDVEFWETTFGYTNVENYVGQGVVCDGVIHENNDAPENDNIIRLQAK